MKELVLGCGNYRKKRIHFGDKEYKNPVFLDNDPNTNPDILFDLNDITIIGNHLPFENDEFDEIHAYDVLEHIGKQGDVRGFFREFSEYYRILKNEGRFFISCPGYDSKWAWGDPGHTRVISKETFTYFDQEEYKKQVGLTQLSDYRYLWKGNFVLTDYIPGLGSESNSFILKCIK